MYCPECRNEIRKGATVCGFCGAQIPAAGKKENVLGGVVGAMLGSLLGAACIILLDQLGFVASLSGLVLAICSLKGYELLGGKLSGKGILICIILMLTVPYFANQVSAAISFMGYVAESGDQVSFAHAFAAVPALLSECGYDYGMYTYTLDSGAYYRGLAMIYGFTVLGAFSTVKNALKKK